VRRTSSIRSVQAIVRPARETKHGVPSDISYTNQEGPAMLNLAIAYVIGSNPADGIVHRLSTAKTWASSVAATWV
jgi:hypothetical protein